MRDIYDQHDNFVKYAGIESRQIAESSAISPVVTIFIPTYKRTETLELTVQSAIQQRYTEEYEILIINNDSDTEVSDVKAQLGKWNDSRISYYVNTQNIGACGNWNRGIELAKGQHIAMIHDDDLLSPYFLETVLGVIAKNGDAGVIGVDYFSFSSSSLPCFQIPPTDVHLRKVTKQSFFFGRYVNIAGLTIKKSLAVQLGGYSEEYSPNIDTVFIYQALLQNRVININFPLAGYRKEFNDSLSSGTMNKIVCMIETMRRNIAQHESFARRWMNLFDAEFLYQYVQNANNYWGVNLDYKEIFQLCGLQKKAISFPRLVLLKFFEKIEYIHSRRAELQ